MSTYYTIDICIECSLNLRHWNLHYRPNTVHPCIVNQYINPPKPLQNIFHRSLYALLRPHVQLLQKYPSVILKTSHGFQRSRRRHDRALLRSEGPGESAAYAAVGAACDQDDRFVGSCH